MRRHLIHSLSGAAAVAGLLLGGSIAGCNDSTTTEPYRISMTLAADPPQIVADGQSTSVVTASITHEGAPVPGYSISWGTNNGGLQSLSSGTDSAGHAQALVTSATTPGTATVTARAGEESASIDVAFVSAP